MQRNNEFEISIAIAIFSRIFLKYSFKTQYYILLRYNSVTDWTNENISFFNNLNVSASLSADSELHICRAQLDHNIPHANKPHQSQLICSICIENDNLVNKFNKMCPP